MLLIAFEGSLAQSKDVMDLNPEELKSVQVYSASMYLQSDREAPSSVTVITAEQIRQFGYRTLADALRSVRGFDVTYDRNYAYVGVRGFSRPGGYNDQILLLINGHRLNDNVYDQAHLDSDFPLDVDLIERIEIVRGPSSSLYGTSAFLAVINVITKTPQTGAVLNLRAMPAVSALTRAAPPLAEPITEWMRFSLGQSTTAPVPLIFFSLHSTAPRLTTESPRTPIATQPETFTAASISATLLWRPWGGRA